MILITAHSLVGVAKKDAWSQAQSVKTTNGVLVLILAISKNSERELLDLASIGGAVFERFNQSRETLASNSGWLEWVRVETGDLIQMGLKVEVIIASVKDGKVWIFGEGEMGATLLRNSQVAALDLASGRELGIEGLLNKNDYMILGTKKALSLVEQVETKSLDYEADELGEALAPLIAKQDDSSMVAMIVIKASEEKQSELVPKPKMWNIKIKRESSETRRYNTVFGGLVIGILFVLVIVGVVRRSVKLSNDEYEGVMARVTSMMQDAANIASDNPERSRILIDQSKEVLNKYISGKPKAEYERSAKSKLSEIEAKQAEILKVRGSELNPTIDLSVVEEGLMADKMESDSEGRIYFVSNTNNRIVGFDVNDLSQVSFDVNDVSRIGPFYISDGVFTALVDGGIWRGNEKEQGVVVEKDSEWGKIAGVATFGQNIYLLDTGMGEIWKYASLTEGYADRRRWFGAGIVLDLSKIVDWVVDGDVWLLSSSGKVEKYSRGVPAEFEMSGIPSNNGSLALVDPVALSVVDDKVYVLERGGGRVVVFGVDGSYKEQYVNQDFTQATDMVIYANKGYVLVNNVVKEWEL